MAAGLGYQLLGFDVFAEEIHEGSVFESRLFMV
jgi:hypothetical protein